MAFASLTLPPLKIHSRLSAEGSQIHSKIIQAGLPKQFLSKRLGTKAYDFGAEEGCKGCIIVQEETRSNLCRPGAANSALTPTHHTHPPALILKTYVLRRPHYKMRNVTKFMLGTSHFRLSIVHTMPSVLLYHSISKSCISGHLLSRLNLDICTFLPRRPKVPESYVNDGDGARKHMSR